MCAKEKEGASRGVFAIDRDLVIWICATGHASVPALPFASSGSPQFSFFFFNERARARPGAGEKNGSDNPGTSLPQEKE